MSTGAENSLERIANALEKLVILETFKNNFNDVDRAMFLPTTEAKAEFINLYSKLTVAQTLTS